MFYLKLSRLNLAAAIALFCLHGTGCTVISAVDAVASTAIGVSKVAVKGTTAVVGAVIPDGDDEDEKKKD